MCGRYTLLASPEELSRIFRLPPEEVQRVFDVGPRYNIAPTDRVAAVRLGGDFQREPVMLKWGLIPHWAREASFGARTINARAETVASKPAFRDSFRERRCLVLANGFYEWQRAGGHKQPYYIRMSDGSPFAFAGLWDRWQGLGQVVDSCTIITTQPNAIARPIHDRMPAILDAGQHDAWLDANISDVGQLSELLRPFPPDQMIARQVSTLVNKPANDLPECIEPIDGASG